MYVVSLNRIAYQESTVGSTTFQPSDITVSTNFHRLTQLGTKKHTLILCAVQDL